MKASVTESKLARFRCVAPCQNVAFFFGGKVTSYSILTILGDGREIDEVVDDEQE